MSPRNSRACVLIDLHRRLIGRKFDDPSVTKDIQSWPFKVVETADGNPKIEVEYLGETKQFTAQEISSMVLIKVRIRIIRMHMGLQSGTVG